MFVILAIENFNWKAACIKREEQHRYWENSLENMRKFHFEGAHFGCVNVVELIEVSWNAFVIFLLLNIL